ncbi:hypothetical protein JVU11DRAFT_11847 [Chiua virens]|nr:hypothetical protein JVU11DRAFT_11847 [Chiua virens]
MESFQLDTRLFIRQAPFLRVGFKLSYIWDARWTVVKAIFLFNRYGTLVGQSLYTLQQLDLFSTSSPKVLSSPVSAYSRSLKHTAVLPLFPVVLSFLQRAFYDTKNIVLVILRAWAIWGCTYRVVVALTCVYVLYLAVCIGLALLTMVMTLTQRA